jgi:hypothetical protein
MTQRTTTNSRVAAAERRCERPGCDHRADQHATGIPEQGIFLCQVEGCPCASWLHDASAAAAPA